MKFSLCQPLLRFPEGMPPPPVPLAPEIIHLYAHGEHGVDPWLRKCGPVNAAVHVCLNLWNPAVRHLCMSSAT